MKGLTNFRFSLFLGRAGLGLGFLGLWEFAARSNRLDRFFFSQPSSIAQQIFMWFYTGRIWHHLLTTGEEMLFSFVLGSVLGAVSGFLLGRHPWCAAVFEPYLRLANAVPRIVLAPIFLLWFGLGIASKVALGVTVVFFIVFFNTYRGVQEVPKAVLNNARMLGASEWQLTAHVFIPSAATWIFSSLHVSLGFAVIAAVVGEYVGSSEGIGYLISQAQGRLDTTGVFSGLVILSVFVLVVGTGVQHLESRFLKWKPPQDIRVDTTS